MSTNVHSEPREDVTFAASRDGTKIAFEKVGSGPALIVVGGALSDRRGGKALAAQLAERMTVYLYDRRGRGDSTDTKPYAVEREVEDLSAIIDRAGERAHVYGVSSGAALALHAAAKLGPESISKLALYEPPYGQDAETYQEQKNRIHQLVQTGEPGDAASSFLSGIGMPPPALADLKGSPQWQTIKKLDYTLAYDYAILGDGTVPAEIRQIEVPTLVLVGEKTLPFMHPTADRIAELIPGTLRKTLPGQTHQASPEIVAPVLLEFFGVPSGRPATPTASHRAATRSLH